MTADSPVLRESLATRPESCGVLEVLQVCPVLRVERLTLGNAAHEGVAPSSALIAERDQIPFVVLTTRVDWQNVMNL